MPLHLDKDTLHHAYLLEGNRDEILEELLRFLKEAGIAVPGSSEFLHMHADVFKMEDARNLKSYGNEKSFSAGKKIYVITANSILSEAQQTLLKIFEEPMPGTHFFLIVPDAGPLLKTLVSRFYVIRQERETDTLVAENFIAMHPAERIEFIKELLAEEDEENEAADSVRTRALGFLNALEATLSRRSTVSNAGVLEHIFKVRRYLRMPGSSAKSLMESVALIAPVVE